MAIKITYEYYDPKGKVVNKKKPAMHPRLEAVLLAALAPTGCDHAHIVHIGTTASETHYKLNPNSKHSGVPPTPPPQKNAPEAIDVVKLYLKSNGELRCHFDLREDLQSRKIVADWIKTHAEARMYHVKNKTKNHLHIETK